ncbi:hypothetical protein AMR41_28125 [Hapalosiphon sp. MRB220]|nr:hypothetical protein AMR41_28125 [Hapalosiphon sp. MRB220]
MELQETQKQKAVKKIINDRNIEQANKSEFITQVKTNNVISNKSLPDPRLIIVSTLMLASLLFVAAIYYGIINP